MAVTYGYFDSIDGDRTYNADQMSEYFEGLVGNGVYEDVGNALVVTAGEGMTVNVGTGRAIIQCKWLRNKTIQPVTISQSHVQFNRWTAVIVKLDAANRKMEIGTKDGTPGTTPAKPEITENELCLAWVYVASNVTSIQQSMITDARATSVCGWVTGLIEQVDTSTLFLQFQDACETYIHDMTLQFNEWLEGLTARLNVNTFISKFEKRLVTQNDYAQSIMLTMDGYTYEASDIILVYINGLLCTSGVDYTFTPAEGQNPAAVTIEENITGTEIKIIVLKSKIGFNTLVDSSNYDFVTENAQEIVV